MSFNAGEIKKQKMQILASGLLDSGIFNKRISEIRKTLRLPKEGFRDANVEAVEEWYDDFVKRSDAVSESKDWIKKVRELDKTSDDFQKRNRQLHKEIPVNFLSYSVEEIMEEYPDLGSDVKDTLHDYILYDSIPVRSGYHLTSDYKGNSHECVVTITEPLTRDEMEEIFRMVNALLKHKEKHPMKNFENSLKILELSKKKGEQVESVMPDEDFDGIFSDDSIVVEVLDEELLDARGREEKNKAIVRTRRKRLRDKMKKYFPLYLNKNVTRNS